MIDESGEHAKILAVPAQQLTSAYEPIKTYRDVSTNRLENLSFFSTLQRFGTGQMGKG